MSVPPGPESVQSSFDITEHDLVLLLESADLTSDEWELTPLQQRFLMRPVSAEDAAGRPATRTDLEAARGWFGPGELEMLLAMVNHRARMSGADTLPHCLPLCDTDVR